MYQFLYYMNKKDLKEEILTQQKTVVKDLKELLAQTQNESDIDESDTIDREDLARQDVASDKLKSVEIQLNKAEEELKTVQNITLESLSSVLPGAAVITDTLNFYISISSHRFEYNSMEFIGLATDAPIYAFMRGKKKGDAFKFGKTEYVIKEVY